MTRRKHIALAVQLAVALRQLGLKKPRLDHNPALGLREKYQDEAGRWIYVPAEDDPDALQWLEDGGEERAAGTHNRKTFGTKATSAGSDVHAIAKVARITEQQTEFRARMLRVREERIIDNVNTSRKARQASRWPKRKMRSKQRGR